jgi:hypothetical protein
VYIGALLNTDDFVHVKQGCQIFRGATYQNGEKYTKTGETIPKGHKIYQITGKLTKWPLNILTSFIGRSSKIYPNRDFWFENIPSGNPE